MPVLVTVQYPEGRDYSAAKNCMEKITDIISKDFNIPPTDIRVTVKEIPQNRYSVGGVLASEGLKPVDQR